MKNVRVPSRRVLLQPRSESEGLTVQPHGEDYVPEESPRVGAVSADTHFQCLTPSFTRGCGSYGCPFD